MSVHDRRRATRYPAVVDAARVGWWEGKHFRTAPARIEDISTGGAAISIGPDSLSAPVLWVCLAGPTPNEWVQAHLTGVTTAEDGSRTVRLAFPLSCPYELFKRVAWGEPAAIAPPPPLAVAPTPDGRAEVPTVVPPPLLTRTHARMRPTATSESVSTCVVVLSLPFDSPPTLCEAEQSIRARKDRVAALSWIVAFAVGLVVAVLLGVLVRGKLEGFRFVESPLKTARP